MIKIRIRVVMKTTLLKTYLLIKKNDNTLQVNHIILYNMVYI